MVGLTPENMTEEQLRHTSLDLDDAVKLVKLCSDRWFGGFWITRNGRATVVGYCGHYTVAGKGQCSKDLGAIRWSNGCGQERLVISIDDWDTVSLRAARTALRLAEVDMAHRSHEVEVEIGGWVHDRRFSSYSALSTYWRRMVREQIVARRAMRESAGLMATEGLRAAA